ncbi:MAG TPA: glycerol-3-phosphate acyltransferase [Candidatus Paceibacterota bacterium]|nr:glycerol-3-phosphate acyltransferase [Candidatus Paceibacterota bacterium]
MSWIDQWHSVDWSLAGILCLFAYVLGCFTSGYYFVRWFTGKDIRQNGSGSVGARNVGRILGKKGFFLTVFFDTFKGVLTVLVARHFTLDERIVLMTMAAVVAGHVWPVQLRFHGGKGMATSLGSLLVFNPELALAYAVLFLCLFALLRKTVLPGLFALACIPPVDFWLHRSSTGVVLLSLWAGLVLFAHRRNFVEEFSLIAARRHPQPEQPPL